MNPDDSFTRRTAGGGTVGPGLFGKLPAVGDFVRHAVPRAVVDALDQRLSAAVDLGRRRHGAAWPTLFAEAPSWRFALPLPRLGGVVVVGMAFPSRDRVGRPYPLVLLASLPDGVGSEVAPFALDDWFAAVEGIGLAAVEGRIGHTQLASDVSAVGQPRPDADFDPPRCLALLREYTGDPSVAAGLWWSFGHADGEAVLMDWPDLPPVDQVTAMFDGGWRDWSRGDTG